ncbi:MAG: acyl-ACP--UDP-N-acetylglucosamine O-acyltransferase [Gammaproteobacteria bacterium]|nr:MAG: acyl-ACP--UDP-N-acetylglucosamine O-acyltransferase [Gammaproteobacteria bacterium]
MIDPRAVIDPAAKLAADIEVGPFAVIGPDVVVGAGTWIGPHTVINGPARIGRENRIYQFSSIGDAPQDKKYTGEPTLLEVGDRNVIREFVTINRGTTQDAGVTRVGNDNWIMAYAHIAHDCQVGSHTVFSNNASLAGHVVVDDYAILGGFTLVHQYCYIGSYSFSSFGSVISKDVPPFVMVAGNPAHEQGLNTEGMRRHKFSEASRNVLRQAYRIIYRSNLSLQEAQERLQGLDDSSGVVVRLTDFLARQKRGIVR